MISKLLEKLTPFIKIRSNRFNNKKFRKIKINKSINK